MSLPPGRGRHGNGKADRCGCGISTDGGATKKRRGKWGCRQDAGATKKARRTPSALRMPPGRRRYKEDSKCGCRQDAGAKKKRRYKTLSLHGSATSVEGGHLRPALALFFAFDKPWAHE
jgi:hypothetical protein